VFLYDTVNRSTCSCTIKVTGVRVLVRYRSPEYKNLVKKKGEALAAISEELNQTSQFVFYLPLSINTGILFVKLLYIVICTV
jgi:hypothetical protein